MLFSRAHFVRSVAAVAIGIQLIASIGCDGDACGGCDCTWESCMYRGAYDSSINRQTEAFEYSTPIAVTWKELVAMAKEESSVEFPQESPAMGRPTQSNWVSVYPDCRKRWVARFTDASHGRYAVALSEEEECATDGGAMKPEPQRKLLGEEWFLIQRVEPQRAQEIKQAADKSGQRSGTVGRGVDRGCQLGCEACDKVVPPPQEPSTAPTSSQ